MDLTNKVKYIPWVLGAILLVIVVVSVNELFKQQTVNSILKNANNDLKIQQDISEDIIEAQNDSIANYQKELKKLSKVRKERKVTINKIDEERKENIIIIANDDAVAHVRAIGDIFRQYDSSN